MLNDVKEYVKCCKVCTLTNTGNRKNCKLGKRQCPGKPIDLVSIDFVVELPLTSRGHFHILTIVDNISKCEIILDKAPDS